jgi:hypothetical protein
MSDPIQKTANSPLARLRLARTDRHDARVVFDIQGAIAVLDHSLFAQSPWSHLWPVNQQAILVRNPDAWRLRVLSGPYAEHGGIASGEWVLDSGLRLEWSGWALTLEVLEPGFDKIASPIATTSQVPIENDSRSSLYKLASSLAAAQLRMDQQSDKQKQREAAFTRKRKNLGRSLNSRLKRLKKVEARLARAKAALEQDQFQHAASVEELASQRNELKNTAKLLGIRERRIHTLRRKAALRWREHIRWATGLLRQNQSLLDEKLNATQLIVDQLSRRDLELLQAEAELAKERTRLDAENFARQQEYLAHQGDYLLKQGELKHHEERLRNEARILGDLGAPLREALGRIAPDASQAIVELLQERISAMSAEPVRAVGLDSWQKRIELWASSISERELAVSHREQELLRVVAEYREIRERREAELSASFLENYLKNIQVISQMPAPTGGLVEHGPQDILSFPSGTSVQGMEQGGMSASETIRSRSHSGLVGKRAKQKSGSGSLPQFEKTQGMEDLTARASLIRRETQLGERARRLAEEAVVLERYRMRLMGASENPARSREEIRSLKAQLRKRMGLEELTLKAAKKEILDLFKSLKRQKWKIARRAEAIARERLNEEEKSSQNWVMDILLGNDQSRPKAA